MATSELRIRVIGQDQASGPLGRVLQSIQGIATVAAGMLVRDAIGGLARQVMNLGRQALDATASYEMLSMSMQSLAARELRSIDTTLDMSQALELSSGKAEELLSWITQLAIKSPFDQAGVADAFRTAMAYGFTSSEAQRLTQATIDMATATGASTAQMGQVALALGQVRAAGKLTGQELLQFVNAGVPALQMVADYYGITTAEAKEMISDGLVPARDAFEAIVGTLEDDFAGAAERSGESWAGLLNALDDIKTMGLRALFDGIGKAMQPVVAMFTEWLQGPGLALLGEWGREIGAFASDVVDLGAALGTALTKGEGWESFIKRLPGWMQPATTAAGELLAKIQPLASGLAELLGLDQEAPPWQENPDLWRNLDPQAQQGMMDAWQRRNPPRQSLREAFLDLIPDELQDEVEELKTALENIRKAFEESQPVIQEKVDELKATVGDVFGEAFWATAASNVADGLNSIAELWSEHGEGVMGIVTRQLQWILAYTGGMMTLISGTFAFGLALMEGDLDKADAAMIRTYESFMNTILSITNQDLETFRATWRSNSDKLALILNTLSARIATWLNETEAKMTAKSNEMWESVQEAGGKVLAFFQELPGKISSALGGIDLYSLGANIVQGLINGLLSKVGSLEGVVRGIARTARAAGGDEAGEGSPARKWIPLGQAMMQGIELGFERQTGDTLRAMRHSVGALGGAGGARLPAGALGRGGMSIYIPITVSGAQDPRAVAREVKRELAVELRPLLGGAV